MCRKATLKLSGAAAEEGKMWSPFLFFHAQGLLHTACLNHSSPDIPSFSFLLFGFSISAV